MIEILEPTREERASALDQFAGTGSPGGDAVIPAQSISVAGDRIVGAQKVAVYRDETRVLSRLKALAAAAGDDWYYRFPVKNRRENRTDYIEGPSIKLANDLARLYGNCSVSLVRCLDLGNEWQFLYRFVDYETGFDYERPWRQTKGASRLGGDDAERRLDISFQIGASKAIRNVIVNALQTYSDFAFHEARRALVDKIGKDLERWRDHAVTRLSEHVDLVRVERVIGRKFSEWLAPDVARVIAMMRSVQDGMATLDETFPPLDTAPKPEGAAATDQLDRFAEGDKAEAPKKRGRPTGWRKPKGAETPQDGDKAEKAPEASQNAESAAEPSQGIASAFQREVEATVAAEDTQHAGPSAQDFVATVIAELDQARSVAEVEAIIARHKPTNRGLSNSEDRMDVSAIFYAYQQFAGQNMTEAELEREVAMRRDLIGKR